MSLSQRKKENRLKLSSWNLPVEVLEYYKKHGVEQMFPWQVYVTFELHIDNVLSALSAEVFIIIYYQLYCMLYHCAYTYEASVFV